MKKFIASALLAVSSFALAQTVVSTPVEPIAVTRIPQVHLRTSWKLQTGPNIGGTAPSKYSFTQGIQWMPSATLLSITGTPGKYCDWLAGGISFSLPTNNSGNVKMHIAFQVDGSTDTYAQAIEMDTKITDTNKITYNGSLQFDYSQSATLMHVQIDKSGGGWVDTGITPPKWSMNTPHSMDVYYQFNTTAKTYSVMYITLDGVSYSTPASLHNLPGTNAGWAAQEILPQLQQDGNTKGGSWNLLVTDQYYDVW